MTRCLVGLGSNLGDSRALVLQAIQACANLPQTQLLAASSLWGSTPVDAHGPDYVNAVVALDTDLQPIALLHALQKLECQAGRVRDGSHNAPRTLDLDLLWFDGVTMNEPELTLPHPRMTQRAFVLLPMAEVAPDVLQPAQLRHVRDQGVWRLSHAGHVTRATHW